MVVVPVTIVAADVTKVGVAVIVVIAAVGGAKVVELSMVVGCFVGDGEAGLANERFAIWSANERRGVRHWVHLSALGKFRKVQRWHIHLSTSCGGGGPSEGALVGGAAWHPNW